MEDSSASQNPAAATPSGSRSALPPSPPPPPANPATSNPAAKVKKPRSRVACKRCHDRRTKCDVATAGTPCTPCTVAKLDAQCQVLHSKRVRGKNGRYSCRPGDNNEPRTPATTPIDRNYPLLPPINSLASGHDPGLDPTIARQMRNNESDLWSNAVNDRERPPPANARRVFYVGDPWTLRYIMQLRDNDQQHPPTAAGPSDPPLTESSAIVHIAVPVDSNSPAGPKEPESSAIANASRTELSQEIQNALLESYFTKFHPLYPIVDQQSFRAQYAEGRICECLRLSILYAGALHAPDPIIHRAGFDTRPACLVALYRRAKAAYFNGDAEDASEQLAYIQASFLLHNMWEGPNTTMDPWTWLGLSIRMAQNVGMHRSTAPASIPVAEKKLWKRIWWCLYIRDRQVASALGKPLMIRDEDCDIETLTPDDFEEGDAQVMRYFLIEQAKLTMLLGAIITSLFTIRQRSATQKDKDRTVLLQELESWKENLPEILKCHNYPSLEAVPLLGLLLEVLFDVLLLLLHRPRQHASEHSPTSQASSYKATFEAAIEAAATITRVTETIMNHGTLHDCPLAYTSAIFAAMTIHTIRGHEADQQLSLCMIGMRQLSTMYFAAGWIRNLFQKFTEKRAKGARLAIPPTPTSQPTMEVSPSNTQPTTASDPSVMGSDSQTPVTWNMSPYPFAANTHPFGLASRNVGGFLDYSMMPDGGIGEFDPHIADYWQDIWNANLKTHQ